MTTPQGNNWFCVATTNLEDDSMFLPHTLTTEESEIPSPSYSEYDMDDNDGAEEDSNTIQVGVKYISKGSACSLFILQAANTAEEEGTADVADEEELCTLTDSFVEDELKAAFGEDTVSLCVHLLNL
jgi:hypothetical protein